MAFDKNRTTTGMKVIIVIFCVILVLTLMVPGLASLTGNGQQQQTASTAGEPQTLEEVDTLYSDTVTHLEEHIAEDPADADSQRSLGSAHLEWGFAVMNLSQTLSADDPSQAEPLAAEAEKHFRDAIAAYDVYLEDNESDEIETSRAIARYYSGDIEGAIAEVEDLMERSPSFSPGWANLGQFVESTGDFENARIYYERAVETDPDDQYHVKGYVEARLAMLDAIEEALNSAASAPDAEVEPEVPEASETGQ